MDCVKAVVFNIMRYSTQDGPGIRTTVFLKGCPLTCSWCHNPESQRYSPQLIFRPSRCLGCGQCVEACPNGAVSPKGNEFGFDHDLCEDCGVCALVCPAEARQMMGREMSVAEVMAEVKRDVGFFDESGGGVTLGGGEPLARPEFALALLAACRKEEIATAVDTSGAVPRKVLEQAARLCDLFLYDLKVMDEGLHRKYTGRGNREILDNLSALHRTGANILVRVPFIPGVNDDTENFERMGRFLVGKRGLNRVQLLPYHPTGEEKYRLLKREREMLAPGRPSDESMARAAKVLESFDINVTM